MPTHQNPPEVSILGGKPERFFIGQVSGGAPLRFRIEPEGFLPLKRVRIVALRECAVKNHRFTVIFKDNTGEALLQFSILFGVEMIMLNSTKNGQWQVNEQISCKDVAGLGFDPIFTLDFLAGSDLIEVSSYIDPEEISIKVNGLHVYNFKHRETFDQANLLEVSEGMEAIHMVSINDSTQATAEVLKAAD